MKVTMNSTSLLDSVDQAIADIAAGKPVVVVDDEDRENEGDLIFAAELATPELVAFMVRYSSGYVCVGMPGEECDWLGLPPMIAMNEDVRGTAYTVTIDAAEGIDTGISATDRAHTIRLLSDSTATRDSSIGLATWYPFVPSPVGCSNALGIRKLRSTWLGWQA